MGKGLRKFELLQEIGTERTKLDVMLGNIKPRQMTQPGVTLAGWSVKDILGHLIGWQELNLEWFAVGQRGEIPELPAQGLTWRDIRLLNDRIFHQYHRRSLAFVLEEYHQLHHRMIQLIDSVSDHDLTTIGHFNWTGPTWTLSDYIRANTASHYRWACKHIRKWLKTQQIF